MILTLVMLMRWQVFFVNEFEDAAQIAQEEEVGVVSFSAFGLLFFQG